MSQTIGDLLYYGDSIIIVDPGEVVTDLFGLETSTVVWKIAENNSGAIPSMFSPHPDPNYPYLNLERRRIQKQDGWIVFTGDYAGVNGTSEAVYELTVGVQDEPIVSHPKFVSSIGGTPSAPLHGAVFLGPDGQITSDNSLGQFAYFSVNSDFAGIEGYLAADFMTWRERYCTNSLIVYNDIGFISPPNGIVPVTAINWIKVSMNIEQRGLSYVVCNEWRAGGRRGWNNTIYTR